MSKRLRQQRILDLVGSEPVTSQEHLRSLLEQGGFSVTQSTLSRDIKELALVKGVGGYQASGALDAPAASLQHELEVRVARSLLRCSRAGNLVVLKTAAGDAQALALALDRAECAGLLGTVAGDDTILLIAANERAGKKLSDLLHQLAGKQP